MVTLYNACVPYRLFSAEVYLDQVRAEPWMRRTARMSWSTGTCPTGKEKDLPCPSSLMTVCDLASIHGATQDVLCALNDLYTAVESLIHEIIAIKCLIFMKLSSLRQINNKVCFVFFVSYFLCTKLVWLIYNYIIWCNITNNILHLFYTNQ